MKSVKSESFYDWKRFQAGKRILFMFLFKGKLIARIIYDCKAPVC